MGSFDFNGTHVELNEEGFLADPTIWTEELALILAKPEEGLDALNDQHWAVIRFIRRTSTPVKTIKIALSFKKRLIEIKTS